MPFQEMKIKGAWIHTPIRHNDERGHFEEKFKLSQIESGLGRSFSVKQVNQSESKRGVIRGVHHSTNPDGQSKYVSCQSGAVWDVVIDLRADSPTFGEWDAVEISPTNGISVLISEGLGHAFLSLEENSVVTYLCDFEYRAEFDLVINPFSSKLNIPFDLIAAKYGIPVLKLSDKDEKSKHFN
jgi:dTDP-4-dehydrorhamnose 3,5-epimerase